MGAMAIQGLTSQALSPSPSARASQMLEQQANDKFRTSKLSQGSPVQTSRALWAALAAPERRSAYLRLVCRLMSALALNAQRVPLPAQRARGQRAHDKCHSWKSKHQQVLDRSHLSRSKEQQAHDRCRSSTSKD
jgi:hypothetical protein